jgi:hypothetical protein
VLEYVFEHPKASVKEIAKEMGISENRVYQIKAHPKFQACFPEMARRKLKASVPELTGRYIELAKQDLNLGVAEKVVSRVLDSQKVLESTPPTQTNVFVNMSFDDLKRKVDQTGVVPGSVVDSSLIDEPGSTTP